MTDKKRILVVEDERIVAEDIKISLRNLGYDVSDVVSSGEEAIIKAGKDKVDLALMDIKLKGDLDGIEAASKIHSNFDIPVVFLTAHIDEMTIRRAKITEPFGYIIKPFENRELQITIEMALYKWKMEKLLKETEKWFSTALWSIGDAVIATNKMKNISFMNPAAEKLTQWNLEDAIGKPIEAVLNLVNEETGEPLNYSINKLTQNDSSSIPASETVLIDREGKKHAIKENFSTIKNEKGTIIGNMLVFHDITEHKQMEQESKLYIENLQEEVQHWKSESIQYEKMASLGSLVSSVAHEINNPLAYVKSNSEFIREGLSQFKERCQQKDKEFVVHINNLINKNLRGIDRIVSITQTLRRFTKLEGEERVAVDINQVIEDTLLILQNQFKYKIKLNKNLKPIPKIICNIDQLNQVFMNIFLNSSQSMDKGEMWIGTWSDEKNVYIEIRDNGRGIPEKDFKNIFDPLTSSADWGAGLGLNISYRIIKEHNGELRMESKIGEGTKITIKLPKEM